MVSQYYKLSESCTKLFAEDNVADKVDKSVIYKFLEIIKTWIT
jgi:hypothetical protein